jgi:transposase InsO family protein
MVLLSQSLVEPLSSSTGTGHESTQLQTMVRAAAGAEPISAALPAEHRLTLPRHPQTNGMVERFNGRINELLQQTRFDSRADLYATLMNYLKLYNHHIPRRALDAVSGSNFPRLV